jgi:protein involved in polysaccharide export with SLBB domain
MGTNLIFAAFIRNSFFLRYSACMKLTRLLLTVACVLGLLTTSSAQTSLSANDLRNVKIDAVSDAEIADYYEKAAGSGLSNERIYQVVQQKGLPAEEVSKLKQRIDFLKTKSTSGELKESGTTEKVANTEAEVPPKQVIPKDLSIFGAELFASAGSVFVPDLRIATPSNYVLGPDDELIVNVYGYSEQVYNLTVSKEGSIYIPNVGPLFVSGLSIEEATARIKSKLSSTIYRNISSGATKVQVTLGKIRSVRVTVIGEASKPGSYTVPSLATLFNLLYLCGGPSDMGSYRNIELIRGNKVSRKIDLYGILVNGDFKDNVLLNEGDVIRIPYYAVRVTLKGQVKREGRFEMLQGETFSRLLEFAGGFTDSAYRAAVQVTQVTDEERKIADLPAAAYNTYQPKGSDYFTISRVLNRFANRVSIAGAVQRPGDYELDKNMTVQQLIAKAGGLREDAYVERGVISRLKTDLSPESLSFNVQQAVEGASPIPLVKEDVVNIASKTELKDEYKVSVEGEVHVPGEYKWRENLTVKDLILLSGGFTEYADASSIEVSRRVRNANVNEKEFKQAEIIHLSIHNGSLTGDAKDLTLQPFDIVVIRPLSGYVQQRSIYVSGQVMNPGRYIMETNTQRFSNMVKRFGGFKSAADSNFVTIRRVAKLGLSNEERQALFERLLNIDADSLQSNAQLRTELNRNYDLISVDVKKALSDENSTANIMLEDGDVLLVDRASSLIKVSGAVYYPTVIPYEGGRSMKYYVERSGSFTDDAQKRGAMVIYPDGKAKTISKFFFFKNYPSIMPRSEIFVPVKSKNSRNRLSTGEWVAISSIFATLGTLFITAFRNN